jgi:Zn finger protein HypA/HybF involved in hydrogenase expression
MSVASFQRTLDQELVALVRGISLECMVCGEFVLHAEGAIACPECRSILAAGVDLPEVAIPSVVQAG